MNFKILLFKILMLLDFEVSVFHSLIIGEEKEFFKTVMFWAKLGIIF